MGGLSETENIKNSFLVADMECVGGVSSEIIVARENVLCTVINEKSFKNKVFGAHKTHSYI